jgi:hypothetical protein
MKLGLKFARHIFQGNQGTYWEYLPHFVDLGHIDRSSAENPDGMIGLRVCWSTRCGL